MEVSDHIGVDVLIHQAVKLSMLNLWSSFDVCLLYLMVGSIILIYSRDGDYLCRINTYSRCTGGLMKLIPYFSGCCWIHEDESFNSLEDRPVNNCKFIDVAADTIIQRASYPLCSISLAC